jgi:hypothetical protein
MFLARDFVQSYEAKMHNSESNSDFLDQKKGIYLRVAASPAQDRQSRRLKIKY